MKRKIYGAPGQMECKLIIKNGQFSAEVHFRGGSIINRAGRPASYATSRFIEQDIIENSAEFKCGKIVLLHELEVPDDAEELARKAALAKSDKTAVEETTTPVTEPEPTTETKGDKKRLCNRLNFRTLQKQVFYVVIAGLLLGNSRSFTE